MQPANMLDGEVIKQLLPADGWQAAFLNEQAPNEPELSEEQVLLIVPLICWALTTTDEKETHIKAVVIESGEMLFAEEEDDWFYKLFPPNTDLSEMKKRALDALQVRTKARKLTKP